LNGARGFLEHSITEGWRGQAGRRRDPGPDFPWTEFFGLLEAEITRLETPTMEPDDWAKLDWEWALNNRIMSDASEPRATVTKQELAVFLRRTVRHIENTPGITTGSGINITGEGFTLAGIIEEQT